MTGMRVRRAARRWGLARSPLRRRTDRIEVALTLLVGLVLLSLGPLLVWRAYSAGYRDAVAETERDHRLRLFEVSAVLLDNPAKYLTASETSVDQGPVPAWWTAPDGTVRVGPIVPPSDARIGSVVPLIVDVHGTETATPVPPDPLGSAISLGSAAGLGVVTAAASVLALARLILDRYRMRDWQLGWSLIERQWSGRRSG